MITYIDLSKSKKLKLPYLPNAEFKEVFEGKGWSFSYVYHFSELRDVFLAIKSIGYNGKKTFSDRCLKELNLPFVHTPWDEDGRRILEQVNALRNFGLIDLDYRIIDSQLFENSRIGDQINHNDKAIFKNIFFSYYRFKEIMSWFLDPTSEDRPTIINKVTEETMAQDSNSAFIFSTKSRFRDSFIFDLRDNAPIYYLSNDVRESNGSILRFLDVFVKWGTELGLIEKFNLKNIDYQLSEDYKSLSCIYFKQTIEESFDLPDFLKLNYKSKYISIPKLIFRIAKQYRYPIENIKKMVVDQSKKHSGKLSLQRTSEIFLRDTEINFVPIVDNSYVSHILIQ